ncbi:unnamed protein product [Lactuca saligna]|uniref:Uncharacterized protein n=1 Tax=Lactuca saligna TaxID=75948 RepID=A0AA35YBY1_LACSI|nr:unnamed protein product [Lactuca saligna]
MLYNQTFNLDQVAFASEGIKDAQQTVCVTIIKHLLQMGSNKELKGLMKTVKIQDIDNLQDEMMDMMDISSEIQESLGRSLVCQMILMKMISWVVSTNSLLLFFFFKMLSSLHGNVSELDALEADMGQETEGEGVPSYTQPDNEPDLNEELNMPLAPSGHAVPVKPSIR